MPRPACLRRNSGTPREGCGTAKREAKYHLDGWRAIFSKLFNKVWACASFPLESASTLIMARTRAGIQRAKERGVAFGRPTKLNAKQRWMIAERYAAGETAAALARDFHVGEATVWRALNPATA